MPNFQIPPARSHEVLEDLGKVKVFKSSWYLWFAKLVQRLNDLTSAGALYALSARQINTTAPLTGGGDLTADRTLSITGLSVTITTAKLTPGGANGSMTFTSGVLTAQTAAT